MALDKRLPALDFGHIGLEDQKRARHGGFLVLDIQHGRDADLVGQGGKRAAGEPLVEQGGQHAAVDDARVPRDGGAEVEDLHDVVVDGVGEVQRRHDDLVGPHQRAAGQVVAAHLGGDLQVRPALAVVGVAPQPHG